MRLSRVLVCLCFATLVYQKAGGMFLLPQVQTVPIGRAFTNLQQRLAGNTNDFRLTYYLARLHSMAYATNLVEVRIKNDDGAPVLDYPGSDAGIPRVVGSFASREARDSALSHLTNAIVLYQHAIVLLKRSTNVNDAQWMVLPTQLGLAWCLDQAGRTNEVIAEYRRTLKIAWKKEVIGDFNFEDWVKGIWSDVQAGRNPIHASQRGYIGPGVCYSEEIIRYLLKLLDPVKDASEIAQLKQDQKSLQSMGRAVTPLVIPLVAESRFDELINENAGVAFDLDGSGFKRWWGWLTPKAGWLVYDANRTGRVTSALQMFGNVTFWIFWSDGYEALSALDDNGDGILTGAELNGLAVWNDTNSDGVSDCGEVVPVEALGIASTSCSSQVDATGMRWNPKGVTFTNGTCRATYDWVVPACEEPAGE